MEARLYLLLTRSLCRGEPLGVLEAALAGGVDLVQVREKPIDSTQTDWVRRVVEVCATHGVGVIVNDRLDVAEAAAAAGVHLGQTDLDAWETGALVQRDFVLGISTHDPVEMTRAAAEQPDYVGIGPCFPTETKGFARGLGPAALGALVEAAPVPAFAIGGITAARLAELRAAGIERVAVSAAILTARDPKRAAAELRSGLA